MVNFLDYEFVIIAVEERLFELFLLVHESICCKYSLESPGTNQNHLNGAVLTSTHNLHVSLHGEVRKIYISRVHGLFVLRFYGPVNSMGSCRARSVCLTTHFLGRLSPGLLVAHFENIGFYTGSSSSKYRLFTGFSIKNIG